MEHQEIITAADRSPRIGDTLVPKWVTSWESPWVVEKLVAGIVWLRVPSWCISYPSPGSKSPQWLIMGDPSDWVYVLASATC